MILYTYIYIYRHQKLLGIKILAAEHSYIKICIICILSIYDSDSSRPIQAIAWNLEALPRGELGYEEAHVFVFPTRFISIKIIIN